MMLWIKAPATFDNLKLRASTSAGSGPWRTRTACCLGGCVTLLSMSVLAPARFLKLLLAEPSVERLVLWWSPDTETLSTRGDLEWTRKDVDGTTWLRWSWKATSELTARSPYSVSSWSFLYFHRSTFPTATPSLLCCRAFVTTATGHVAHLRVRTWMRPPHISDTVSWK